MFLWVHSKWCKYIEHSFALLLMASWWLILNGNSIYCIKPNFSKLYATTEDEREISWKTTNYILGNFVDDVKSKFSYNHLLKRKQKRSCFRIHIVFWLPFWLESECRKNFIRKSFSIQSFSQSKYDTKQKLKEENQIDFNILFNRILNSHIIKICILFAII